MTALATLAICAAQLGQPIICPPPRYISLSQPLPASRAIITGGDTEQAAYARRVFRQYARPALGKSGTKIRFRLREVASPADLARLARAAGLPAPPADRFPDSYLIICSGPSGQVIASGPGLIYGALTAAQLFCAGRFWPAKISDWPAFTERGYTGCARDVSPSGLSRLDMLAASRLNAAYYEIYADRGQDSVPPVVRQIAAECRRRGIFLYGLLSNWRTIRLVKRPLCAANREDLARIRRLSEELMDHGCRGLIFLFDDIPRSQILHPKNCPLCRERFPTLARLQLGLLLPMLEVAREKRAERLMVCPTPYWRGWQTGRGLFDGRQYFREWAEAPQMRDVAIYHCIVRGKDLQELFKAGLRNYAWWCNGVYPYERVARRFIPQGCWGGLNDYAFTWYLTRSDPERGAVPTDDAYKALRELHRYTRRAWICNGGWLVWQLWGAYCWAGDRFDAPELRRLVFARLLGPAAVDPYLRWEQAARPAMALLTATDFSRALTEGQQIIARVRDLARRAAQAAADFKAATHAQPPGSAWAADQLPDIAKRMATTARKLAQLADAAAAGATSVSIGPTKKVRDGAGLPAIEIPLTIRRGLLRWGFRYCQATEPDGRKHRCKWHFGAGLGWTAPSNRNWYDAGFFDLLINGRSLDAWTPQITQAQRDGQPCLRLRWQTDAAEVTLDLRPTADGAIRLDGRINPRSELKSLAIKLYAIPGAGRWDWKDMNKAVVTPSGTFPHGKPVTLKPGERWLLFMDRHYDVPAKGAEGPCAAIFLAPNFTTISTDNGGYVVTTTAQLPPSAKSFTLLLYDLHGLPNFKAMAYFRQCAARWLAAQR